MIDHYKIILAGRWNESFENMLRLLARMQNDLEKYKEREDAKENVIAAKQLTINSITGFVDLTSELIDTQSEMLREQQSIQPMPTVLSSIPKVQRICDMSQSEEYMHNEIMESLALILDEVKGLKKREQQIPTPKPIRQ